MMGGFRPDAHTLQGQADLTADILAFVLRCDVHIAGIVIGLFGRCAVFIQFEQIELHFRAEGEGVAGSFRVVDRLLQQGTDITFKGGAVRIGDGAEHSGHLAVFRPPGKDGEGIGVRVQKQIRAGLIAEAGDGRSVDGNATGEGPIQLRRHNGNVFRFSGHIAECQPKEFHILLLHKLHDFLLRILHIHTCLPFDCRGSHPRGSL